jgi:predicted permease
VSILPGAITRLISRIVARTRRDRLDAELAEEMRFHRDSLERDLRHQGLLPDAARYAAARRFGNPTYLREESRAMWSMGVFETIVQDVKYALRFLRRSPGFAAVAVVSLALGIGANTAVFTLIDRVMLQTLPVHDPESLVQVSIRRSAERTSPALSYPSYVALRDRATTIDGIAVAGGGGFVSLQRGDRSETLQGGAMLVSGNYFDVLGLQPHIGRLITPNDTRDVGGSAVVVLDHAIWTSVFGGDPAILGRVVRMNEHPFTIVGVAPPEFFGTQVGSRPAAYFPVTMDAQISRSPTSDITEAGSHWLYTVARPKPGVSHDQVAAELTGIYVNTNLAAFSDESAEYLGRIRQMRVVVTQASTGFDALRRQFSKPLWVLMGLVGVVLLIACANVANLLLARAASRQREIAVRLSLGAARGRLVRQLLTEGVLLSVAGAVLGLVVAKWGTKAIVSVIASGRGGFLALDVTPDATVLGFTFVVAVATGLFFGLVPALGATRIDLTPALKDRVGSVGRNRQRAGRFLVVTQVALATIMMVATGLFVKSLVKLRTLDTGFRQEGLMLVRMNPQRNGYRNARLADLYSRLEARLDAIPGVRDAVLASNTPFSGNDNSTVIAVPGYTPPTEPDAEATWMMMSPGYFRTLGTRVLAGREFVDQDNRHSARPVAMVNEAFARKYFAGADPVGKHFEVVGRGRQYEIVGLVGDAKFNSYREETPAIMYFPILADTTVQRAAWAVLDVPTDHGSMASVVRREIAAIDPALEIFSVRSLREQVSASIVQERLVATLSSFFGAVALLLAIVGLYGIMAYAVARRTNEIGIRMALGAARPRVVWMVVRETLVLGMLGLGIGVPIALALGRFIRTMLFGMTPTDTATLVVVGVVVMVAALVAGFLPGRRAARVDPLVALRSD